MDRYGYKKGDLLRWTDLVKGESYVGLYLGPVGHGATGGNDIIALVGDKRVVWSGWQCDKLDKGEWTCK